MKTPKTPVQISELELAETYLRFVRERLMRAEEPSLASRASALLQEVDILRSKAGSNAY